MVMVLSPHRVGSRLRLRVGAKFFLAVGVLVLAVLTIAGVGAVGLARMAQRTTLFYDRSFAISQHAADVVAATDAIHETALYQVAVHDPRLRAQLNAELDQLLIPRAQEAISVLRGDYAGQPGQQRSVDRIEAGLRSYQQLRSTSVGVGTVSAQPGTDAASTALARRIDGILEPIVDTGAALRAAEATVAARTKRQFDATYRSTRQLLALSVVVVLLLGLAIVVVLTRDMVPRIRRYSRFAADVAAGRATTALHPRGRDELAELGSALDDMVRQRELAGRAEHAQRAAAALAEQAQAEYVDTLQVTRTEDEAQDLLQRHLERSLPESTVVVLRRNNSANRLQAATALPPASELAARLVGAEPRACVAVRLGRTHREGTGRAPLLGCGLRRHPRPALHLRPAARRRRGHRLGAGHPPGRVRRHRHRPDQDHRRTGCTRVGQPAQPGPGRVPREQRLADRPAEQTGHRGHPQTDGRPGQPLDHPPRRGDARPRPLQSDQRPVRSRPRR